MKALILGAGYGTRLERDLKADASLNYKHLIGTPKPLLPIGSVCLISRWMQTLEGIDAIDQVYVVTNQVNNERFAEWAKEWPKVKLTCDASTSNETRIGAVACMNLSVEAFDVKEDLIIIAGDTLFYGDFDLADIIDRHQRFQQADCDASTLVYVSCTDEEVHKYGILETNENHKVIGFLEKPQPHETVSRKECPCFYLLSKAALPALKTFLEERKDEPLKSRDATGNFIAYLYKRMPVYATEISGRFDVGGLQSYIICDEYFSKEKSCIK